MADTDELSIVITPVQLYAWLNGKSVSQAEISSNTWHEMPSVSDPAIRSLISGSREQTNADVRRYLADIKSPDPMPGSAPALSSRQSAWEHQSHYSQPTPPDCWQPPPPPRTSAPVDHTRAFAVLGLIGGGLETVGGVLLLLAPDPTLLTKVGGGALTLHGADTMQAAMRQLFSGQPTQDLTQQGATWAAHEAGASDKWAGRIGVIVDVGVPLVFSAGLAAERIVAIRSGRIILSEEAVAGKAGRISLAEEEADKAASKEGGHTLRKHVPAPGENLDAELEKRAMASPNPGQVTSKFLTKELAEQAVNDAVRANRDAIRRWAANPASPGAEDFFFETGSTVGRAFLKSTKSYEDCTRILIRFAVARKSGKLFYLLSAFPVPK